MGPSYWIMLGFLAAAVVLVVLASSGRFEPPNRVGSALMWGVLLCCYGVCVGLVACVLTYVLHISDWLALATAVPVALLVFVFVAWLLQ